ncbi:fimbrial protein [Paraburkholderia sp. BL21I4N1]|uniref:fimbrial protein n=1 Tax=Paraburkholderia sp. BL21I4N1 TaxID=1938801 RepID=UPI000CFC2247|nr:fimbrial protein [Paraburkholderia sp. BL21I4N1]PQV46792.1 type 1 fimbria pilin [Paraburkholderia sp. BL21I4N1]
MFDWFDPGSARCGGRWANTVRCTTRFATARAGVLLAAFLQAGTAGAFTGSIRFPGHGTSLSSLAFAPTIPVPNNPAVGQVVQSVSHEVGLGTPQVLCRIAETVAVNGTLASGSDTLFATNVPGLGVRYSIKRQAKGQFRNAPYATVFFPPVSHAAEYHIMAELVVTGPLGSGTLTTIPSLTMTFAGRCFETVSGTQHITPGSRFAAGTCSVGTRAIQVALPPRVSPSNLMRSGATPFSIGLDCAAPVRAYLSLDDAANPGNRSTILSAAAGSTAKGVGMQIMSESRPLSFGPHDPESGNLNVSFVGKMRAGANLIPLSARYVRTGPVSGGTVKGLATFTMSYQ